MADPRAIRAEIAEGQNLERGGPEAYFSRHEKAVGYEEKEEGLRMLDKVQFTLYEIFGYLFPGTLAAIACALIYWALCLPGVPLPVYKIQPNITGWIGIVSVSYLMGHLTHGIGGKFLRNVEILAFGEKGTIPAEVRKSASDHAARLMGVSPASVDAISLFRFADEYVVQKGNLGDRDVFVYREGFYKGCTVGFLLLSLALFIRAIFSDTRLGFPSYIYIVSRMELFTSAVLCAFAAGVCRQRFYRFGTYRVVRALFAFLAIQNQSSPIKEKSTDA